MGYENNDILSDSYTADWLSEQQDTVVQATRISTTISTTASTTSTTITTTSTSSTIMTTKTTTTTVVSTTTSSVAFTTTRTTSSTRNEVTSDAWDKTRLDMTESKNDVNWKQLVCKTENWRERNPKYCKNCKKANCNYDLYTGKVRAERIVCTNYPVTDEKC